MDGKHWVLLRDDGSESSVVAVSHSFDEAVLAGQEDVTLYATPGTDDYNNDIASYKASLAEAMLTATDENSVQWECGSASWDYRIEVVS